MAMNRLIIITILTLTNLNIFAQSDTLGTIKQEAEIFLPVDKSAEFPGGMGKFYAYIMKNLKYPEDAKQAKIVGKVFVEFVINKDGSIDPNNIKVREGLLESCNQEAMRLIKECPNWIPALIKKEPVKQRFVIPITFKI